MKHEFTCSQCGEHKVHENENDFGGVGYAVDKNDNKICYACCAINDAKELNELQPKQKAIQYWNGKELTNWPGTLRIKPYYVSKGKHNMAGTREDIYFMFNGRKFHAVQYGNFSQIAHINLSK